MDRYNLNFHSTFSPDRCYLSKIIEYVDSIEGLDKEEISIITGIPTGKSSGKVEPHIQYAKYMNLINCNKKEGKFYITRTALGNEIFKQDLYMNERLTKLLINYFLTSKYYGAQMWNLIFREYASVYGNRMNVLTVTNEIEKYYCKKVKFGAFNSTYMNDNSLKDTYLLKLQDDSYKLNSAGYEYECMYMYLYTLLAELERMDFKRNEFTYDEIFNDIKWNLGFQWTKEEAIDVLQKIESKGLILINKQLNPITIILNVKSNDVLSKIYSLLL